MPKIRKHPSLYKKNLDEEDNNKISGLDSKKDTINNSRNNLE